MNALDLKVLLVALFITCFTELKVCFNKFYYVIISISSSGWDTNKYYNSLFEVTQSLLGINTDKGET